MQLHTAWSYACRRTTASGKAALCPLITLSPHLHILLPEIAHKHGNVRAQALQRGRVVGAPLAVHVSNLQ